MKICYIFTLNTLYEGFLLTHLLLLFTSKVPRPEKLAVHVFEVDEDVDKDEVSENSLCIWLLNTGEATLKMLANRMLLYFWPIRTYFQFVPGKEIKGGFNEKCCHHRSGTQDSSLPLIPF